MANNDHSISKLFDSYTKRRVTKGSVIIYQGEVPQSAYVVVEGIIKVYGISAEGEERIVNFLANDEIFPTAWVFDRASSSTFYYEALTDCQLYQLPRTDLLVHIKKNSSTLELVLNQYIASYTGAMARIAALEQPKAYDKVLHSMFYLIQRYGVEVVPGFFSIRLDLTHQILASFLGLTRETTALELGKLKKKKILSYKRQRYLINREKLLQLIGEGNYEDLKIINP